MRTSVSMRSGHAVGDICATSVLPVMRFGQVISATPVETLVSGTGGLSEIACAEPSAPGKNPLAQRCEERFTDA